jgi:Myb-like DNA-binding domain
VSHFFVSFLFSNLKKVRTLLRHWGMTKLQRPAFVGLGYDCGKMSSSKEESEELKQKDPNSEECDITMGNSDHTDMNPATTTCSTSTSRTLEQLPLHGTSKERDTVSGTGESQESAGSVNLLTMTPQEEHQIIMEPNKDQGSQQRLLSKAGNGQRDVISEKLGNNSTSTPGIRAEKTSKMPPNSVLRDYAKLIAREMAMEEEDDDDVVLDANLHDFDKENSTAGKASIAATGLNVKELLKFSPVRDKNNNNGILVDQSAVDDCDQVQAIVKSRSPRRTEWRAEAQQKRQDIFDRQRKKNDTASRDGDKTTTAKRKHINTEDDQQQQQRSTKVHRRPVAENDGEKENLDFSSDDDGIKNSTRRQLSTSSSIFVGSDEEHRQRVEAIRQGIKIYNTHAKKWDKLRKKYRALNCFTAKEIKQYYQGKVRSSDSSTDATTPIRNRLAIDDQNNNNSDDALFDDDDDDDMYNRQKKRRIPFSEEEVQGIIDGIDQFGVGRWADIKRNDSRLANRTQVQIKDKYRTMVQQGQIN